MSIGMQHNVNRCTVCNNPKDDKRRGPCCICVANGKVSLLPSYTGEYAEPTDRAGDA